MKFSVIIPVHNAVLLISLPLLPENMQRQIIDFDMYTKKIREFPRREITE